eukprot:4603326-Prymnesium_polylepis.1
MKWHCSGIYTASERVGGTGGELEKVSQQDHHVSVADLVFEALAVIGQQLLGALVEASVLARIHVAQAGSATPTGAHCFEKRG